MRRVLTRIALLLAGVALGVVLYDLSDPYIAPPDDFVAFWSAARLFVAGDNPYDPTALLQIQRTANWVKDHAYRVWEPPWALPLIAPIAALPYQSGRFVWFVVNLALLVASADRLWVYYGGDPARRGLSWLLAITFAPAVLVWRTGQLTTLVLAGIVAFLVLEKRRSYFAAGAVFAALASMKPHVPYLVWPALAVWVVRERRWRAGGGAVAAATVLALVTMGFNASVFGDFVANLVGAPPGQPTPTLGTLLRLAAIHTLGRDPYWAITLPPLGGMLWLAYRWRTDHATWRWDVAMPQLLLVSVVTGAFGWIYDAVLLLVPVVRIAANPEPMVNPARMRGVVWCYVAINLGILAMDVRGVDPFWYVWAPLAFLLLYTEATRGLLATPGASRYENG